MSQIFLLFVPPSGVSFIISNTISSRGISRGIAKQKRKERGGKVRARGAYAGRLQCGASKEEAKGRYFPIQGEAKVRRC